MYSVQWYVVTFCSDTCRCVAWVVRSLCSSLVLHCVVVKWTEGNDCVLDTKTMINLALLVTQRCRKWLFGKMARMGHVEVLILWNNGSMLGEPSLLHCPFLSTLANSMLCVFTWAYNYLHIYTCYRQLQTSAICIFCVHWNWIMVIRSTVTAADLNFNASLPTSLISYVPIQSK